MKGMTYFGITKKVGAEFEDWFISQEKSSSINFPKEKLRLSQKPLFEDIERFRTGAADKFVLLNYEGHTEETTPRLVYFSRAFGSSLMVSSEDKFVLLGKSELNILYKYIDRKKRENA